MFNAVRNKDPTFCRNLNVSRTWHSIYENNLPSCNKNGFSFRAFKITTSTKPTCQILVMLGNALCDALNGIRQNTNTVRLETDNLFWLTQSNLVWADIVGDSKAQEYLLEKLGDTAYQTNLYDQNKDLIHSHFRPNRLPSELNQILGIETEEFHQQLSKSQRNQNNMSKRVLIRLSSWILMKKNSYNCYQCYLRTLQSYFNSPTTPNNTIIFYERTFFAPGKIISQELSYQSIFIGVILKRKYYNVKNHTVLQPRHYKLLDKKNHSLT